MTLVGFVESISVAKMYAQKHGYDIVAGSELKALGLANMVRNPTLFYLGAEIFAVLYAKCGLTGLLRLPVHPT